MSEDNEAVDTRNVTVGTVKIQGATAGALSDVSFCFTGALNSIARNEAEKLVRGDGGTTRNSVTKDLTYLVTNSPDSGSGKAKKAQELGISILSEDEFLAMVRREK